MNDVLEEGTLFREVQRPKQLWLWALHIIIVSLTWVMAISQLVFGMPLGDNPADEWLMVVILVLLGLVYPAFFLSIKLTVEVRKEGLFLRFSPFHRSFVDLRLDTVVEARARAYSPLREYGGWGIRYGHSGTSYTIGGRDGVELTYPKDRHILIGSQRAQELEMAIRSAMRR